MIFLFKYFLVVKSSRFRSEFCPHILAFSCYGVNIAIRSDDIDSLTSLFQYIPYTKERIVSSEADIVFDLIVSGTPEENGFFLGCEEVYKFAAFSETDLEWIESKIHFSIARYAIPEYFLFHAGAVAFEGAALIFPGESFSGKTSLTREFLLNGGTYFSDDCAVVDKFGNLFPFPTPLALRSQNGIRSKLHPDDLGATVSTTPSKLTHIIFTKYIDGARWCPSAVAPGQASFQLLQNLFYQPAITKKPAEALRFLTTLCESVTILASPRNEAIEIVDWIKRDSLIRHGK